MIHAVSNEATESAQAFASLNYFERNQMVQNATKKLSELHYSDISLIDEAFEEFAKRLLESGRFNTYLTFNVDRRLHILDAFIYDVPIETFFLLDEMKQGVDFTVFTEDRNISFQEFDTELLHRFDRDFSNLGTDDFRQKLHEYFAKFGYWVEYHANFHQDVTHSGTDDENMALAAFVLRRVYGEKKVMLLLEKMISENHPIRALDFIKLIKSGIEYKEYPLSWAITLIE